MSRRTFWNTPLGAVASLAIAVSAVLLFLVALPVTGPILTVMEARANKRKRAAVVEWPCGRCAHPLGLKALARADAVFTASIRTAFAVDGMPRARIVRDLDACCRAATPVTAMTAQPAPSRCSHAPSSSAFTRMRLYASGPPREHRRFPPRI